jgi:hypothetical protein
MRIILLLIFTLFIFKITAQNNFIETTNKINSLAYHKSSDEIIYATDQFVYFADFKTMMVTDSIKVMSLENQYINNLELLNTPNPAVLIYTKNKNTYYADFYEYPADSIYFINLNKKVIGGKFSGNSKVSFNYKKPEQFVESFNKYYRYKNNTGNFVNSSEKGFIKFYPDKTEALSNGIIRNLKISPSSKEMAIVYYDSIGKDYKYHYTLETRALPSLKVLKTKPILNRTNAMYFSDDGSHLILKKNLSNNNLSSLSVKEEVEIYETSTLKKIKKIPDNLFIESLIEKGSIWKKVSGKIINETYDSKRKIQEIWANLTPFSIIDGFIKVDEDILLIYGNKGNQFSKTKNGITKYSLSNEAAFSKNFNVNVIDTLFQPYAIKISNNKLQGNQVQLNKDKSLLITGKNNNMQIWSSLEKRKLYDLQFKGNINPFLSDSGGSALIFESYEGIYFNDFKINFLNLKTGLVSADFFENPDFNALGSKCYNIEENKGEWICSDGFAKLFKIDAKNKTINVLTDFTDTDFYRTEIEYFKKLPNSKNVLIAVNSINVAPNHKVIETKFKGFKIYNSVSKKVTAELSIPKKAFVSPISKNNILYQTENELLVYNSNSKITSKINSNSDYKLLKTINHKDLSHFILEKTKKNIDSFLVISYHLKNKKINNIFKIPYSTGHFFNEDGMHYQVSNQYFTFSPLYRETTSWNNPKPLFTQGTDFSLASNGKMLLRNKWLFDLNTLKLESEIPSFYHAILLKNNTLFFIEPNPKNVDKPHFQFKISKQNDLESVVWESEKIRDKNYQKPNAVVYSENKKYVLAYYNMGYNGQTLYLINTETKTIKTKKIKFDLDLAKFTEDEKKLVISFRNKETFSSIKESIFFDVNTFEQTNLITANYSSQFNATTILDISSFKFLVKSTLNENSLKEEKTYYGREHLSTSKYLKSKNLIVAGTENGKLIFWNPENKSPIKTIKVSSSKVLKFKIINEKLYVFSKDSEISIINLDELKLEVTCTFFEKDDELSIAWLTPEGFFNATKNDIRNFHFVKKGKAFPLINYELFLNRPDEIMEKVGFTPKTTIEIYRKAYLKRLKRNNYSIKTDFLALKRPEISLINRKSIKSITKNNKLKLEIKNISNADTLNIFINGVPVSVDNIKNKPIITKNIKLNYGSNNISIISKLKFGAESDPISLQIKNSLLQKEAKIYYVGVGVSKYLNTSMNLKYADKDVRKLSEVFARKYKGRIEIDTLLNENVTLENVKALKRKLKQTSIDDTVIISFSGHGLIDSDNRFYFASHNIDFDNPKVNGIAYKVLQGLLTEIPARRKLLLIDACHSGEIDSDKDLKKTTFTNKNIKENIPKGVKGTIVKKGKKGLNNSFDLMKSLFYDMDRGNGSFVISAAGGYEFAYEDEKWENGVFTYSFINALYDLGYDTWKGEQPISISKIKKYVYDKVKKLTNDKQKPTSRAENLEWDWVLK